MSAATEDRYPQGVTRAARLTPERVRTVRFSRTSLRRRGYAEEEVDRFLDRVADDVAASDAEKAALRAEIDRLKNWYREQGVDTGGANGMPRLAPNVAAVNIMSQAQQAADTHVARAQDYARRLIAHARQQYEEILAEAQRQAEEAARQAASSPRALTDSAHRADLDDVEQRIAYLRTFADVMQVQLRGVVDGLAREVDKLAGVGQDDTDLPHPGLPSAHHR